MKTKVSISVAALKTTKKKPAMVPFNIRIEVDLKEAFEKFVKEGLKRDGVSEVLRDIIKELCVQNGFYP